MSKLLMILTKQIFDTLKKAGVRPQIGKFTNTRLLSEDTLYNTNISDFSNLDAQQLFNKIKFESEFLPQATESQLSTFLENIRTFETMNPNFFTKKTPIYSAKTGENLNKDRPQDVKTLVDDLNKDLKGKSAFQGETVNPKTGEVRELQTPIRLAEEPKSRQLTKEEIQDYEEAIGRNSEEWMLEGTVKEAEEALKRSKAEEAYYLKQYKGDKYNQDIIKAADEIFPNYDDPRTAADQILDSYAQMKYGLDDASTLPNKEQMSVYRQAYDYALDYNRKAVKNTAEEIRMLDEFDITGREPNAMGGIIGRNKKMIRKPTPKNISSDLLSILKSGIGSQFKVRG